MSLFDKFDFDTNAFNGFNLHDGAFRNGLGCVGKRNPVRTAILDGSFTARRYRLDHGTFCPA